MLDEKLFREQCNEIGGEYNKHTSRSSYREDRTYHDCEIEDENQSHRESEGEYRTLQWVEKEGNNADKASVSVTARGGGTIKNPKMSEVNRPSKIEKRGAEEVGVPARATLRVVGEDGPVVRMKGTGEQ